MSISWPNRQSLTEGNIYTISWLATIGETVSITASGKRTPLGTTSRGNFSIPIAKKVPAVQGEHSFKLPWIDAGKFTIRAKEYDSAGRMVASGEREYEFRPLVLANRTKDGLYLDLHASKNQRIYVQKDGRITRVYISSSSENYRWLPPNKHIPQPHDHAGVFQVLQKNPSHWSSLYNVSMPWSMRYLGGHYIHATSKRYYKLLGRPASHGCNRLSRYDAQQIFNATPVGTRVEIIGPGG